MNNTTHSRRAFLAFSLPFLVAVICYFFRTQIFGDACDLAALRYLTKALPIAWLAIALVFRQGRLGAVSAALALSAAGDVAGEAGAFLWQVGFFAAAHLCYIAAFWHERRELHRIDIASTLPLWIVLLMFAMVVIPNVVKQSEQIAVMLYLAVIGTMATFALWHRPPYRWAYCVAAILFCMSDAMIAYCRFVETFPYQGISIMATYFAAQYLFAMAEFRRPTSR